MLIDKDIELSDVLPIIFDELTMAAKDPGHPFRLMSLSTVHQQMPEIRYVVLRAMDEGGHLFFFTDGRTEKIKRIHANPEVALLFYNPEKGVQLRVRGTAVIHRDCDLTKKYWGMVEGDAKKAYNSLKKPGTPISQPHEAHSWPEELVSTFFTVVEILPYQLEVLQLNGLSHIRAKFSQNAGRWSMDWVAP